MKAEKMAFQLSGMSVVVTGASSGIGAATAEALADAGAVVSAVAIGGKGFDDIAWRQYLRTADARYVWRCDVADGDAVAALAHEVVNRVGKIDAWVNCAGILVVKRFLETDDTDWKRLLSVNLGGYINGCHAAVEVMERQRHGAIVNVSSVVDIQPISGLSAYATAKGGIVALTKTLALELGPLGIRVNAVAPGAVDTPLNDDAYTDEVRARYNEKIPLGRIATAGEIADTIVFLCSDGARYVTGHELLVDGGLALNGNVGHLQ